MIRVKERAPRPSRLSKSKSVKRIQHELLLASALAISSCNAQAAERMSYGEAEYLNSCAVCHGARRQGRRYLR